MLTIIQARLGSKRFPRKALAELHGKPLIAHVVERVKQVDEGPVVLAVPGPDWWAFADLGLCSVLAPAVPEDDVLGRFVEVARLYPSEETIMRVTGDCPLWDPVIGLAVMALHTECRVPYTWNVAPGYVDGTDTEVMHRAVLFDAHASATSAQDREHVTTWVRRHYPYLTLPPTHPDLGGKTSIDTPEDLAVVSGVLAGVEQTS